MNKTPSNRHVDKRLRCITGQQFTASCDDTT